MQANNDVGSYNPLLPAIFPIRVGALHDIATVSFAASLIQYKLKLIRKYSDDDDELKLQLLCLKLIRKYSKGDDELKLLLLRLRKIPETDLASVPLPTVIRKSINALLPTMHESLYKWKRYHYLKIFWYLDSCEDIPVSEWLDEIVWMSNGTINYGQTAEKMLHSGKTGAIEKFRLACVYCFEDIVRNVWSTLGDEHSQQYLRMEYHRKFWGRKSLMFEYWYSIMIGESSPDDELIDTFKDLIKCDEDNFDAIEYLWNNVDLCWCDGGKELLWIICTKWNPLYMWRFLIGLNASEFDEAVQSKGDFILKCFADDSRFEEVAITIWRYMLERIVDTGKLVDNFKAVRGANRKKVFDYERETHLIQLMWHYAPEPLRLTLQNESFMPAYWMIGIRKKTRHIR